MKKKFIILIAVLMIILTMCWFAYLHSASEMIKEVLYNSDVTSDKDKEHLYLLPEHTELESNARPGYIARFQGYSITISGYHGTDIDKELADDFLIIYHVGSEKIVANMYLLKSDNLYDGSAPSFWVKKAAGRKINTEYELWEATLYRIPDDFTLFDADKNKGVCILLDKKYSLMPYACYQFDNGVVKGFICTMSPEDNSAFVYFSNCKDPDSCYKLVFAYFSTEEVKEMLSTITFDGINTNQ